MKLSEPQQRVLRTMAEFDCLVHTSSPDGYCWYGGRAVEEWPRRKVGQSSVRALVKRRILEQKERKDDQPYWRSDFALTAKGREIAEQLDKQEGIC